MNKSKAYIVIAALGFSFILIFSTVLKNSGMSSFEQLVFRIGFGLLILFLVLMSQRKCRLVQWRDAPFFLAIGSAYAFFTLSGMSSLAFGTPIAVTVSLIYTQPVYTAIVSYATGKEKATKLGVGVIVVGVSGVFLLTGQEVIGLRLNLGVVFPLLAGCFYSVYLWLKRRASQEQEYTPLQVLFNTFLLAMPILLVAWLAFRNLSANPLFAGMVVPEMWQVLLLICFAAFSTVLPYSLLNYVKPEEVSPISEGLLLLADPLLHTLWAILFFGQYVTPTQYLGAALILSSAALNLKISSA